MDSIPYHTIHTYMINNNIFKHIVDVNINRREKRKNIFHSRSVDLVQEAAHMFRQEKALSTRIQIDNNYPNDDVP